MLACVLDKPGPVESGPLRMREAVCGTPARGEVLVRVRACGVCRTDLHVVEGELALKRTPVIGNAKLSTTR